MDNSLAQVCSWCGHRGVRGDGNGVFMDVDVHLNHFSYPGIPICGGCGGLGVQFPEKDFAERVSRISSLRFKFHPVDSLPQSPTIMPYTFLKDLIREVEELVAIYGEGVPDSFAQKFVSSESVYRKVLPMMEEEVLRNLESIKRQNPDVVIGAQNLVKDALTAYHSGEIAKGERLYLEALKKFPTDSRINHDFGVICVMFHRDLIRAIGYFKKSTELEPKKALHYYQVAKALALDGKEDESADYLSVIGLCPDTEDLLRSLDVDERTGLKIIIHKASQIERSLVQ